MESPTSIQKRMGHALLRGTAVESQYVFMAGKERYRKDGFERTERPYL